MCRRIDWPSKPTVSRRFSAVMRLEPVLRQQIAASARRHVRALHQLGADGPKRIKRCTAMHPPKRQTGTAATYKAAFARRVSARPVYQRSASG